MWKSSRDAAHAEGVLARTSRPGPPALVRTLRSPELQWEPLVADDKRRAFAYVLRRERHSGLDAATVDAWFAALHPDACGAEAWTDAQSRGKPLLRRTAWVTFLPECSCEYGYADTWQLRATDDAFVRTLEGIRTTVAEIVGLPADSLNCVNLNYCPCGGGVGFLADDEFLFDGMEREATIVSLSLCAPGGGERLFQVRRRDGGAAHETVLRHGDLMTMEGLFQLFWLHSVYPGDRCDVTDDPLVLGERINLTFRRIVQHLDGSTECRGQVCALACNNRKTSVI